MATDESTARQGHETDASLNQQTPLECPRCGHLWTYTGSLDSATCPSCQKKIDVEENRVFPSEDTEYARLFADGGTEALPSKTVPFPVTVPREIEEIARERLEHRIEHGPGEFDTEEARRLKLKEFLQELIELDPQYLTRDVVNEAQGKPVDRALYSCVTADQYERIKEVVRTSDDVDTVQKFVREAVTDRLGR